MYRSYSDQQYFTNNLCECSLEYFMAYSFLIIFNLFGYFLIIFNVFNINFGLDSNTVKFVLVIVWFLFSCILSRLFCIKKINTRDEEIPLFNADFTIL